MSIEVKICSSDSYCSAMEQLPDWFLVGDLFRVLC